MKPPIAKSTMKSSLHVYCFDHGHLISRTELAYIIPQSDIIYNSPTPDIIFVRYANQEYRMLNQIIRVRMQFGWKPLLCLWFGEPPYKPSRDKWIDYTFSCRPTNSKNCYRVDIFSFIPINNLQQLNKVRAASIQPKSRFCNFIYRVIKQDRRIRNRFCQQLMEYKQVDCPGEAMNNMPNIRAYDGPDGVQAKLDFMVNYKFTIAFENTSADYYITEKILHPLMVGSIPIYWGSPKIAEYFNPECFINCHDYDSFSQVIERIKEIDNDPKLYQKYMEADPILPNSRLYEVQQQLIQRLTHIGKEVLQRRKSAPSNKLISLWKVLMLLWENRYFICHHNLLRLHRKIREKLR